MTAARVSHQGPSCLRVVVQAGRRVRQGEAGEGGLRRGGRVAGGLRKGTEQGRGLQRDMQGHARQAGASRNWLTEHLARINSTAQCLPLASQHAASFLCHPTRAHRPSTEGSMPLYAGAEPTSTSAMMTL